MKVTTNWNLGNFSVALATEAEPQAIIDALLSKGLLQCAQRVSVVDKTMGAFITKDGKQVRKEKWSRGDVAYSEEMAGKLAGVFKSLVVSEDADGNDITLPCEVTVTRYDGATSADSKQAQRLALAFLSAAESSKEGLEKQLASRGYTGPTHDDKGEFHPDAMAFALTRAKAKIAEQKAELERKALAGM